MEAIVMWHVWPRAEDMVVILSLVAVILTGLVRSRHEPDSAFLAAQRWTHRDLVIVWGVLTVIHFVPGPAVAKMTGMQPWAIQGLSALLLAASVCGVVRWRQRRPWLALGFDSCTALPDALWSLRASLGVVSVLTVVLLLLRLGSSTAYDPPGRAMWHGRVGDFIGAVVVVSVLVPIAEELLFRGLAYVPLFRKFGAIGAAVVFIRDRYLATLVPLAGASVGLWIMSAVLFHWVSRSQAQKDSAAHVKQA